MSKSQDPQPINSASLLPASLPVPLELPEAEREGAFLRQARRSREEAEAAEGARGTGSWKPLSPEAQGELPTRSLRRILLRGQGRKLDVCLLKT